MTTMTDDEARAAELARVKEAEQEVRAVPVGDAIATLVLFVIIVAAILKLLY